jgi:predicted ATPase/DNA-binding CsgD family transcriptional regulator/tetratricopeptide (TPR) repeat protein
MDTVAVRGRRAAAPNNLPHPLTSFVGREADLRSLKAQLRTARMVTLIGTGGAGKSRLAAEVARSVPEVWPDGAWWIELEAAKDTAGAVVGMLELPGRGPAQSVALSWLAAKQALLVLDNCEQLVADCAAFSQAALERCPQLTIIATSREALRVSGEVRWPVASLRDADALQLFEARARLVSPDFKLTGSNRDPVEQICGRLDRLPLAIEMAAARLDVMSEKELLKNLNDRFRLLKSGTRGVPQRQQTMAAAIDWSHRLLNGYEARLFRRLAVFQGGFTLDAAQAVCAEEADTNLMGLLGGLVQKSLVVADRLDDGSTRYRLLESHHDFASERLRESGELDAMQKSHYDYFSSRKWEPVESANFWYAVSWGRDNAQDGGLGLALEIGDSDFADQARAGKLILDLLEKSKPSETLRVKALTMAARLAWRQADHIASRKLVESAVSMARKVGDPELIAQALNGAGLVYEAAGELALAGNVYDEALSILSGSTNRQLVDDVRNARGLLAITQGDPAAAVEILSPGVASARSQADLPRMARYLESLANAQLDLGQVDEAAESWNESLSIFRVVNDWFGIIWSLIGLSLVAAAVRQDDRLLRLAGAADRLSREYSLTTWSFRSQQLEDARKQAHDRLGTRGRGEAAWKEGQTMTTAEALEYALGGERPPSEELDDGGLLSRREREVVTMVAAGMTSKEIAKRLFIAERTAEGHVERIRNKLGVRSRTEVATWAVEHGLKQPLDKPTGSSKV